MAKVLLFMRVMQGEIQRDGKCKEKTMQVRTTACKSVEETKALLDTRYTYISARQA
jgi:hypothetical protein